MVTSVPDGSTGGQWGCIPIHTWQGHSQGGWWGYVLMVQCAAAHIQRDLLT